MSNDTAVENIGPADDLGSAAAASAASGPRVVSSLFLGRWLALLPSGMAGSLHPKGGGRMAGDTAIPSGIDLSHIGMPDPKATHLKPR